MKHYFFMNRKFAGKNFDNVNFSKNHCHSGPACPVLDGDPESKKGILEGMLISCQTC